MPLAFQSINRGEVAFGFFNIETDMLLLEHYFFFAPEFCDLIGTFANMEEPPTPLTLVANHIGERSRIGDLMGAINGIHYSGFIGEVYRRFPFPLRQEDFKQKSDGFENRHVLENLIASYGEKTEIQFSPHTKLERIQIGELIFTKDVFQQLVLYVWLGGYPRWQDWKRPQYVMDMKERAERSKNWLFAGMAFS